MLYPNPHRYAALWIAAIACACGVHPEAPGTTEFDQIQGPLQAHCSVIVKGKGTYDIETEYLPGVVRCENGGAPLEALKVQAVAARSFLYYKIQTNAGKTYDVEDGTQDQVFSCGVAPGQKHYDAVAATAGQVLRYNNTQHCSFYVAGAKPSTAECVPVPGDNDWSNTEKYVTYNWGKSGSNVTQSTLGWVNPGNDANRGCMSQNGSACLANKGWSYQDMLRFYYGMDIEFVTAHASCVEPPSCVPHCSGNAVIDENCNVAQDCDDTGQVCSEMTSGPECMTESTCECNPGESLSQECGFCGKKVQTCGGDCTWQGWTPCTSQGACSPGTAHSEPCGACGIRTSTCSATCSWEEFGGCVSQLDGETCSTGLEGSCSVGSIVCTPEGAYCQSTVEAGEEVCDGVDNDCDGQVDEDATVLGANVPWAADLNVADTPTALWYGERRQAIVSFVNVGTEVWPAGQVYLVAKGTDGNASSLLQAPDWFDGHNVVTTATDTPPGETAIFSFDVQIPADVGAIQLLCPACVSGAGVYILEQFQLKSVSSGAIRCPNATLYMDILVDDARDGSTWRDQKPPTVYGTASKGCTLTPQPPANGWPWVALLGLLVFAIARRRTLQHS